MNNEQTHTPNITSTVEQKSGHKTRSRTLIVLSLLVLLISLSYGAYEWNKNRELTANLSEQEKKASGLAAENSRLTGAVQKEPSATAIIVTEKLTDDKTISYPLTHENSQIIWWHSNTTGYIVLSHKKALAYVSDLPGSVRKTLCGSDNETRVDQKDIAMGFLLIDTKEFGHNQYANCLQAMAASTINKDEKSRMEAQKVLEEVDADIKAFIESSTIK